MDSRSDEHSGTRQRLLEAAGEVFAEKGFEKATIRQIVRRAGANLNAVNYHFGDKRNLYLAVFAYAHESAADRYRAEKDARHSLPPAAHLRAFVDMLLRGMLLGHERVWPKRLMFREIAEPTGALEVVIEQLIRPRFEEARHIIRRLLPPQTSETRIGLCAESVVAQCVHLVHAQPVLQQLMPELGFGPDNIDQLIDHITSFSLAALSHAHLKDVTS